MLAFSKGKNLSVVEKPNLGILPEQL